MEKRIFEADKILTHANMQVKRWIRCGEVQSGSVQVGNFMDSESLDMPESERMLGVLWVPEKDVFRFTVRINLTPLKNKVRTGPDVS